MTNGTKGQEYTDGKTVPVSEIGSIGNGTVDLKFIATQQSLMDKEQIAAIRSTPVTLPKTSDVRPKQAKVTHPIGVASVRGTTLSEVTSRVF